MALDLTQKTKLKPQTGAQIILGLNLPNDLEERFAAQEDPNFQQLLEAWDAEKDPTQTELRYQEMVKYWAKRRKELGFEGPMPEELS